MYNQNNKNDIEMMYSTNMALYAIVYVILLFWAVMLALNSQPPENRVFHIILAMLFSPLYVLSYYVNVLASRENVGIRYFKQ